MMVINDGWLNHWKPPEKNYNGQRLCCVVQIGSIYKS